MTIEELSKKINDSFENIRKITGSTEDKYIDLILEPDFKEDPNKIFDTVKEYDYQLSLYFHQLKPEEVLDRILCSDNFEETILELLELQGQKAYKIGMNNGELDIDIFNMKLKKETFTEIKKKKSKLRFNSYGKNTLNIKEMR